MSQRMVTALAASTTEIEQKVELFSILGTAFTLLAVFFLIASVALFFILDIRRVIGEKTGRIARKSIEEMKQASSQGKRRSRGGKKNSMDGEAAGRSSQLQAVDQLFDAAASSTATLSREGMASGGDSPEAQSDGPPPQGEEKSVPQGDGSATTVLESGENNTTVLDVGQDGTTVLPQAGSMDSRVHYEGPDGAPTVTLDEGSDVKIGKFDIIKNIMLIHTDEYI